MVRPKARTPIDRLHEKARARATMFKVVSFGLIGFINTAVDFAIFAAGYYLLGLPILAANLNSWIFAVSTSYVLNSLITFSIDARRELSIKTYAAFLLAQLAGFAANTITVLVASQFVPVLFGKALATGASFLVNFSLSHFVVFRRSSAGALEGK